MQADYNKKRIVTAFFVLAAIALLAMGSTALKKKDSTSSLTSTTSQTAVTTASPSATATSPGTQTATNPANSGSTKDGTYSSGSNYRTPGGTESISVKLTLKNGAISDISISQGSNNRDSEEYQSRFARGYKTKVMGKKLADLSLSNVSGASLTTDGFNAALQSILSQAS